MLQDRCDWHGSFLVSDPRTDLRSLEAFYCACKQGSLHKAADTLHTVQSAISHRIDGLEERLGAPLLDRRRRVLTPAGEAVLGYAERLLQLHREMLARVTDPTVLCGTLNLGVAETLVHTWLPRFLQQMQALYPRLTLVLDVDVSAHLRKRLLSQQLDLAFLVGPVDEDDLHSRTLNREPLVFVASPRFGLPRPATLAGIAAKHPFITFRRNTQPYKALRDRFAGAPERPLIHESASVAAMVRMAVLGLGVALLPRSIVQPAVAAGELEELACESMPDLEFCASWHISPRVGHIEALVQAAEAAAVRGHGREPRP
jgi:DNA-binding transcriptional LysR family regulator